LPAGNERLQDEIAQLQILIQYLPQRLLRYFIHFAIRSRDAAHHLRVAGQMSDVASEFSCTKDPDRLWFVPGIIDELEFTGFNDEEFRIAIATSKQRLSRLELLRRRTGVTPELCNLLFAQRRERNRA
jgi:hypothetical protein